jgi:selenocysteine-specific elongation factor
MVTSSMHVVATAGHVDHGKSSLVAALTGIDPDRWPEEKARGLTIDLGFAHRTLPSGRQVSFVDVPGHVRFLRTMVAGVGAVDACLLVVAATEGWKPQSEEHLRILDLLGIRGGMVVITKAGAAGADRVATVAANVPARLAGTILEGAPVVVADSVTGAGLGDVVATLDALTGTLPTAPDMGRSRLWVDRSFPIRGAGTVVTGTLAGGSVAIGDELVAHGPTAARLRGRSLRVRGVQVHGADRPRVGPGHRAAINLAGVEHRDLHRGDVLTRPGRWWVTRRFDATLQVLAALDHPVSTRGAFTVHLGSGDQAARLRILRAGRGASGGSTLEPGEGGLVRIEVGAAVPLVPGDRYVLLEHGRAEVVGGGEVLDVDPILAPSRARPDRSVERVVAERGWVDATVLTLLTGVVVAPDLADRWVVDPAARTAAADELRAAVRGAGGAGLDVAGLDERHRALLAELPEVTVESGLARPTGPGTADEPWLRALEQAGWSPPPLAELSVDRTALRAALQRGRVVDAGGVHFAASAVDAAARVVAGLLAEHGGVTVAQVRDALGSSRRYVLALLAHFDASGVTRRRGDLRIGGPRLPGPA